ncbi:MAG TPA: YceI family protein [Sphingobacteriaceae bacterium]|nr:YceI family protein [Sphingobacteriaceae bacterium]
MPLIILLILFFQNTSLDKNTLLICKNVKTTLFSEAPLENIEAKSGTGISVLNPISGELQFVIPIRSLEFNKRLMQEHFNENYMESERYPHAKFKGKIAEPINMEKNGEYPVNVTGELDVHGVKRQRSVKGIMKVQDKKISLSSVFDVKCKDHNIKIPQIVFQKIAENIRITINSTYISQ